jgi:very-short-patch-repair endonuclease
VDFVCQQYKLVIELDGGHHNELAVEAGDKERSEWLESRGYPVLRFWNNGVQQNLEGVVERMREVLSG